MSRVIFLKRVVLIVKEEKKERFKMDEDLERLQPYIYNALMEIRYLNKNMLDVLDETIDWISENFLIVYLHQEKITIKDIDKKFRIAITVASKILAESIEKGEDKNE
jgi:hypothetical protein